MSVAGVGVEVAQVVEVVPAAVAVQVAEAVEVVRVAEVVQAVEVDLRVAAVDHQALVAVEAVLVVEVLEEAQVGLVAVLEVDPPAVMTREFAAKKREAPLKASKRAKKPEQSQQKATEFGGAYQFTCQAD